MTSWVVLRIYWFITSMWDSSSANNSCHESHSTHPLLWALDNHQSIAPWLGLSFIRPLSDVKSCQPPISYAISLCYRIFYELRTRLMIHNFFKGAPVLFWSTNWSTRWNSHRNRCTLRKTYQSQKGPPWPTTPPVNLMIVVSSSLSICPAYKSCAFRSK